MLNHPRVVAYGDTFDGSSKPLILIVGREPNAEADIITDTVGVYDFENAASSGFWNVAYRYLANAAGQTESELKEKCRSTNSSPLLIADALPVGVANGNRSVGNIRGAVTLAEIDDHVKRTLALSKASERVKLIVLAGHLTGKLGGTKAKENLAYASNAFREQSREISAGKIVTVDIPFLSNLNSYNLRQSLSEANTSETIKRIFTEYFQ